MQFGRNIIGALASMIVTLSCNYATVVMGSGVSISPKAPILTQAQRSRRSVAVNLNKQLSIITFECLFVPFFLDLYVVNNTNYKIITEQVDYANDLYCIMYT